MKFIKTWLTGKYQYWDKLPVVKVKVIVLVNTTDFLLNVEQKYQTLDSKKSEVEK